MSLMRLKLITREDMSEEGHYSWKHDRCFYSPKQVGVLTHISHTQTHTHTDYHRDRVPELESNPCMSGSAVSLAKLHIQETYLHTVCVGADDEHLAPR